MKRSAANGKEVYARASGVRSAEPNRDKDPVERIQVVHGTVKVEFGSLPSPVGKTTLIGSIRLVQRPRLGASPIHAAHDRAVFERVQLS